jgi:hypothetical protein
MFASPCCHHRMSGVSLKTEETDDESRHRSVPSHLTSALVWWTSVMSWSWLLQFAQTIPFSSLKKCRSPVSVFSPKVEWNILNLSLCWQASESSQWIVHQSRSSLHRLAMHVTDCSGSFRQHALGYLMFSQSFTPWYVTLQCKGGRHAFNSLVSETC